MPGRRAIALLAALLALAGTTAGCGGGKKGADIADPRAEALSYFPRDAGFVALVATDPDGAQYKAAAALARKFPGSSVLLNQLKQEIEKLGADYDKDVRPMLGNDVAFGAAASGAVNEDQLMLAFVSRDAGKLEDVAKEGSKAAGEYKQAKLYTDEPDTAIAVRDSVVVIADKIETVKAAIDRHDAKRGLQAAAIDSRLGDLPKDALLRVVGDAEPLLAGPESAEARKVPWVAALGDFAFTLRAAPSGLTAGFRLDTADANLAPGDLPLANGSQPPKILSDEPLAAGIRNLTHIINFAQRAADAVDPAGFATFQDNKNKVRSAFRVDLDTDIVEQLSGDSSAITDLDKFAVRSQVRDPKRMAQTLTRLVPVLPSFLEGAGLSGATVTTEPNGTYSLMRDGQRVATYGLVGNQLVVGTVAPDRIDDIAGAQASAPPGARGALAIHAAGDRLVSAIGSALNLGAAGLVLGALGDVDGWVRAETDGMRGELRIAIG